MNENRLRLALERLTSGQWERFERFASTFLSSEFPDLRTLATPSGDGGRDAELFSPAHDSDQALQYSVTPDWATKIRQTAARLSATHSHIQLLIYVSNGDIGAKGDNIRAEVRAKWKIHLDIRDRSYFIERLNRDIQTQMAAETLAKEIVDPYLSTEGVLRSPSALDASEAKAAHLYLSLQLRDELQEKGLTKLSFEALVRSILADTHSEHRLSRGEIIHRICALLHSSPAEQVAQLTESALSRLSKRELIRHWTKQDEFCLTHNERKKFDEYLAAKELNETILAKEIGSLATSMWPSTPPTAAEQLPIIKRLRRILELAVHEKASAFASTVLEGSPTDSWDDHIHSIILGDLRANPAIKNNPESDPDWLELLTRELLRSSSEPITRYLHELADAYTVMAFLRQTPDVQSAVSKIFSHGEIWLDTSVVLPLLAEELFEDKLRQFQSIIELATSAGLQFFVTPGVVEEVERHINQCITCNRTVHWRGKSPYLLDAFILMGHSSSSFPGWCERFRGDSRPLQDVADFLETRFKIREHDLSEAAMTADSHLRYAIQEFWTNVHQIRRERNNSFDPTTVSRLSQHDSESYVGIIQRRRLEKTSHFGYSAWWLTFDRAATQLHTHLQQYLGGKPPDSPVISLDFLSQYLTLGPLRSRISKGTAKTLPLIIEPCLVHFLTPELLQEAAEIRESAKSLPDWVTRRKIRDHLDAARRKPGPLSAKGAELVLDAIRGM